MIFSFKNLLHILRRYKTASILNLLGLSVAFTAFILIAMHVRYEYTYNQFPHQNRIFRFEYFRDSLQWEPNFSRPAAELMLTASPHIEAGGLLRVNLPVPFYITTEHDTLQQGIRASIERITPGFAQVFDFKILEGSASSLHNIDQVLIPQSLARKLFGTESAIGQTLKIEEFGSEGAWYDSPWGAQYPTRVTVGGVYQDFPSNSLVANHIYGKQDPRELISDWHMGVFYCYLKLDSPQSVDEILQNYLTRYPSEAGGDHMKAVRLRCVDELYFGEYISNDYVPHGNKTITDILLLIALLVILIASINFVNFSVALTPLRIKGINTQKVLGCPVGKLRRDLILESLVITLLAYLTALFWVWNLQESHWLDSLLGNSLSMAHNLPLIGLTALLAIGVGLCSGLYPAWHMTSFPPALVLNGSFAVSGRAQFIRESLIGIQYVISLTLIVCALFIHLQNRYISRFDMGFDQEYLIQVRLSEAMAVRDDLRYKQRLLEHPDIVDVAFTQQKFVSDDIKPNLGVSYHGKHYYHYLLQVSYNFPALIGIHATQGRDFRASDELRTDDRSAWMFNESAARMMDLEVGSEIEGVPIVGIFPDLHFESMYYPIKPMGFLVSPKGEWHIQFPLVFSYIKARGNDLPGVIAHIRQTLQEIDPAYPAEIQFFDQTLKELYRQSRNQSLMVTLFSLMAVLLAIVGIFGLVVFESQGRAKEIALRRVMGATVHEILWMFNRGFVRIVLLCFVIAVPVSWFGVRIWLQNFAYKTPIYAWVFLVAFLMVLILTLLTVTFQSYRSATTNPTHSLRK